MPTGHYQRKPRARREVVTCAQCGRQREFLPSFLRIHPIRFCGTSCAGLASRKPDRHVEVRCDSCGTVFNKRRDHVKPHNYCNKACVAISRRKESAKWRDPVQIKEYMREYGTKNRERLNAKSRERVSRNRDRRRATQARYRLRNKGAIKRLSAIRRTASHSGSVATAAQIERLFKRAHSRCVYCGLVRPLTLDHVTALTANGTHERQNLVPACKSCNSSKNNRDVVDWVFRSFGVEGLARALMFLEGKRIPAPLFGSTHSMNTSLVKQSLVGVGD